MIDRLNAALSGRYRIERELGEGGMATVFLAEDLRHDRSVALKVLKPELAAVVGAERFLAEIRTTANLEDPHILPLYDSGEADGFLFYAMPYVEGDSLRDRIDRERQLPVDEAVEIAKKVAGALSYAHVQGVVHRDVKPANILLRRGEPLVADFGIALALSEAGGGRITETGLSLGTPHYMSPEQAAGERSLDPRSDVYALGCVLYEMLTGEPPHPGPTGQAVLAKILTDQPRRVVELRRSVPAHVDAVVAHALEKLPADRLASADAFAAALEDPGYRHPQDTRRREAGIGSDTAWKAATGVLAVAVVALVAWIGFGGRAPGTEDTVFRTGVMLPEGQELLTAQLGSSIALSPDGTRLVYTGTMEGAPWQFWHRRADALEATPLPGTHAAWSPVFSPDGSELAYINPASRLHVMDLTRGSVRTVTDSATLILDWSDTGTIYFFHGLTFGNTWRVDAGGGEAEPVPVVSGAPGPTAIWGPGSVLPNERGMVITRYGAGATFIGAGNVVAVDFESGDVKQLVQGSDPRYHADGFLTFASSDGALMIAPFDPDAMELLAPPTPVVEDALLDPTGVMHYDISRSGSLVYRTGGSAGGTGGLVWVDRDGARTSASDVTIGLTVGLWDAVAVSPDGSRVAFSIAEGLTPDIWVQSLTEDAPPNRITFNGSLNVRPRWTPDGEALTFVTNMAGQGEPTQLWRKPAGGAGAPEPVVQLEREVEEGIIGPGGEWVFYRLGGTFSNRDLYARRLDGDSTVVIAATEANERALAVSPDGRWVAYVSDETGRDEVFVRPFPDVESGKWQVSSGGAHSPAWSHDGRELFFIGPSSNLVAARYAVSGGSFLVTAIEPLFNANGLLTGPNHTVYAVGPDDERFLFVSIGARRGDLVWVRNWITELETVMGRGGRAR